MQIITIAGNITKDAELRRTNNGDAVLGFSVAVNGVGRDAPSTFFDCSIWGKRASALEPHLRKGGKVTVSGTFGTREHNGKTYFTVNANEVTLQGGKQEGRTTMTAQNGEVYDRADVMAHVKESRNDARNSYGDPLDDEIPF